MFWKEVKGRNDEGNQKWDERMTTGWTKEYFEREGKVDCNCKKGIKGDKRARNGGRRNEKEDRN